jgi:PAS domain S-box-containing protein
MFQLPPVYFERLLEISLDIVIAVDAKGQIIFYNDGARKTLGYTPAEIRGKHVTTVYPSLDEARKVMAAMRSGEFGEKSKVKNFETTLVTKSGEHMPVAISGSIIYDETGAEVGSIGFLKDLREIRRRDQLATLGELAVGLAHRINNPLEVIFNNLDLLGGHLARVFPDEEFVIEEERIESIQRELAKIRGIINRINELAHGAQYGTTEYLDGSRMADLGDGGDLGSREEDAAPHREAHPAARALAGLTILVVDDDLGVCYSLRDLLREEGCEVEVATNGMEALKILARRKVDLVLSDVVMPDLDGYDLYMEVRERHRDTPIVLMTAYFYDKDHVIKRSRLEGLQEVIFKKPVDPSRLKEIILRRCRPELAAALALPEPHEEQ